MGIHRKLKSKVNIKQVKGLIGINSDVNVEDFLYNNFNIPDEDCIVVPIDADTYNLFVLSISGMSRLFGISTDTSSNLFAIMRNKPLDCDFMKELYTELDRMGISLNSNNMHYGNSFVSTYSPYTVLYDGNNITRDLLAKLFRVRNLNDIDEFIIPKTMMGSILERKVTHTDIVILVTIGDFYFRLDSNAIMKLIGSTYDDAVYFMSCMFDSLFGSNKSNISLLSLLEIKLQEAV